MVSWNMRDTDGKTGTKDKPVSEYQRFYHWRADGTIIGTSKGKRGHTYIYEALDGRWWHAEPCEGVAWGSCKHIEELARWLQENAKRYEPWTIEQQAAWRSTFSSPERKAARAEDNIRYFDEHAELFD